MQPTVYIETSVISYLTARKSENVLTLTRQLLTERFWNNRTEYSFFVSAVVEQECLQGDQSASLARFKAIDSIPRLKITQEVEILADTYSKLLTIPERAYADCLHLALSVVHKTDFLATWNLKHIAGPMTKKILLNYNIDNNLFIPIFCTPEELLEI